MYTIKGEKRYDNWHYQEYEKTFENLEEFEEWMFSLSELGQYRSTVKHWMKNYAFLSDYIAIEDPKDRIGASRYCATYYIRLILHDDKIVMSDGSLAPSHISNSMKEKFKEWESKVVEPKYKFED